MTPHVVPPSVRLLLGALIAITAVLLPVPAPAVPPPPAHTPADRAASRPAACTSNGSFVWRHLPRCGWPAPATTGARPRSCPRDTLRPRGRSPRSIIRITRANTTLSCQRIVGCLRIEASGIRIRDVAIRCTSGRRGESANGTAVIDVRPGATAAISHVTTNGMRGVHACVWHQGLRLRVQALDCRGVNDGIFSWSDTDRRGQGDDFVIANSFFHDFTTRTANGHIDGYQTEGAARGRIVHNTWLMTTDSNNEATSAIGIWNGRRNSRNILVARNLIAGGGFSVYAHDYSPSDANPAGGYSVTRIRFVGNVFSRHLFGCVGSWGVWFPRGRPTDGWRRSGNHVLETRADVDFPEPDQQRPALRLGHATRVAA